MRRTLVSSLALLGLLASISCTTTSESEPVVEPEPEPTVSEPAPLPSRPEPEPVMVSTPEPAPIRELPKTASAMPLVGLTGLGGLLLGGAIRGVRILRRG